ncbi:hypothetical protein RQP46_010213 [Phenoliferia psychrophenolica]
MGNSESTHASPHRTSPATDSDVATGTTVGPIPPHRTGPQLPPELTLQVIEITIESLIYEERFLQEPKAIVNAFLLSASLVDRTWHDLVAIPFLRNALILPQSVYKFLYRARTFDMLDTLDRVRCGVGQRRQGWRSAFANKYDDETFDYLIYALPNLRILELVGRGFDFRTVFPGNHRIQELYHSVWEPESFNISIRKFGQALPPLVSILSIDSFAYDATFHDRKPEARHRFRLQAISPHLNPYFGLTTLIITSSDLNWIYDVIPLLATGLTTSTSSESTLEWAHLSSSSPIPVSFLPLFKIIELFDDRRFLSFPNLVYLETDLGLAVFFAKYALAA